jgi:hypothetical protein
MATSASKRRCAARVGDHARCKKPPSATCVRWVRPNAQTAIRQLHSVNSTEARNFGQANCVGAGRNLRAGSPAELTQDTPSSRTSGLAGQGVDVITSTTLSAPVHRGLRVRSNLRRRVGPLKFLRDQELQECGPPKQVVCVPKLQHQSAVRPGPGVMHVPTHVAPSI